MNTRNYTFDEVMANRRAWIDFLKEPGRESATGFLDIGDGQRCCIGHACFALGMVGVSDDDNNHISYDGQSTTAPHRLKVMLGLASSVGELLSNGTDHERALITDTKCSSLAGWNDGHSYNNMEHARGTPLEIAAYLESVIVGGPGTPFYDKEMYEGIYNGK